SPFLDIPLQPSDQTLIGIGMHKDLDVELFPELGMAQDQDALHDHHLAWQGEDCLWQTGLLYKGIDWCLYASSLPEFLEVFDQEVEINGTGVVEIDLGPFGPVHMGQIVVIGVL